MPAILPLLTAAVIAVPLSRFVSPTLMLSAAVAALLATAIARAWGRAKRSK